MSNIVMLLAGGKGLRMGKELPKQHITLNEHQIIEYTLLAFSKCELVDSILIVSNSAYIEKNKAHKPFFSKLKWVIEGGESRIQSAYKGIAFLEDICEVNDNIIISDGARPCVSHSEIAGIIDKLETHIAVTTALESYETILHVEEKIDSIIPRDNLYRQTSPEGYKYGILKKLYLNNNIDGYRNLGIDQLVEQGYDIPIVKSNIFNFKITTPDDLLMFDYVLKRGFDKIIEQ